ncbi:MAG TPA: PEP-CTERM sorting domain-containing protein [Terriglobia bacterium]
MRKSAFAFCFALALVLGLGSGAQASTVNVTLLSGGGVISHDGGVYVGPYELRVGNHTVNAPCDDYFDEIWVGETWKAHEVPLTASGVSSALFGGYSDADHLYLEAAYLTSLFSKEPTSDYNDIHFALWGLFDPSALSSSNYDAGAAEFLTMAEGASLNFNQFKGWDILVPINDTQSRGGRPQEFIIPGAYCPTPTPTPEPASLLLLGTGLLGIGFVMRRSRPEAHSQA